MVIIQRKYTGPGSTGAERWETELVPGESGDVAGFESGLDAADYISHLKRHLDGSWDFRVLRVRRHYRVS